MSTRETIELILEWMLDPKDICKCLILSKHWRKIAQKKTVRVMSDKTLGLSWVLRFPNMKRVDALVYLDKTPRDYPPILKDIVLVVNGGITLATLIRGMVNRHGDETQLKVLVGAKNRGKLRMFLMGNQSVVSERYSYSLNNALKFTRVSQVPASIKNGHWSNLDAFRTGEQLAMELLVYPNRFLDFLKTAELGLIDPLSPPSEDNKPLQVYLSLLVTRCSTMLVWRSIKCIMEIMESTPVNMPKVRGMFVEYSNSVSFNTVRDYDMPDYDYNTVNAESALVYNVERMYWENMINNIPMFYTSKGDLK